MLLENKIALVTGAAKGIGAECARAFAENGAKALILADIDEKNGKLTADDLSKKCECIFIKTDVSKEEDVLTVFARIKEKFGRLDVLMNVAGICSTESMFDADVKSWDRIMDINLKSVFLFGREAMKVMMEQKSGSIISVASISGQNGGIRTNPAYAVSKAGIICITKSFAKLGAKDNVTANALAPGLVDTDMTKAPDFHYNISEVPMGRVGEPREVADVAVFLASGLSRYVTGQCISVSGGMYMQ
jgi:3-oxoacyl-[acyl-carrier protein] reductase